jgi:hypothetical protein
MLRLGSLAIERWLMRSADSHRSHARDDSEKKMFRRAVWYSVETLDFTGLFTSRVVVNWELAERGCR